MHTEQFAHSNEVKENMNMDTKADVRLKGKKKTVTFALVGAGVLVAGVAAALVIPQVIHNGHIAEYHELTAETAAAVADTAQAVIAIEAANELVSVQHQDAATLATQLTGLSAAATPTFTAEVGTGLKQAADELAGAIAELSAADSNTDDLGADLRAAHMAQQESDKAASDAKVTAIVTKRDTDLATAKDDAAKKKINEAATLEAEAARSAGIAVSSLDLSIDDAIALLELTSAAGSTDLVPDAKVNAETVEQAKQTRDAAVKARDAKVAELAKAEDAIASLQKALEGARAPLERAAAEAPAQAKAVLAAAPRAGTTQQTALTDAAQAAEVSSGVVNADGTVVPASDTRGADGGPEATVSVSKLIGLVSSYVSSAKGVIEHHAAVLAEETAAAAAAAASSGGGWDGGGWDGGGWDGGGWSGGGSGGNSGGGNSGGGSGGGGNGGGSNPGGSTGGGSDCDWGCDPTWHPGSE